MSSNLTPVLTAILASAVTLTVSSMLGAGQPDGFNRDTLRARRIELSDANGNVRMRLAVDDEGGSVVEMYSIGDVPGIALRTNPSTHRAHVELSHPVSGRIELDANQLGTEISVTDKLGKKSVSIAGRGGETPSPTGLWIYGSNGKAKSSLSTLRDGDTALIMYDDKLNETLVVGTVNERPRVSVGMMDEQRAVMTVVDGTPCVSVIDDSGKSLAHISGSSDGKASAMMLANRDGQPRIVAGVSDRGDGGCTLRLWEDDMVSGTLLCAGMGGASGLFVSDGPVPVVFAGVGTERGDDGVAVRVPYLRASQGGGKDAKSIR